MAEISGEIVAHAFLLPIPLRARSHFVRLNIAVHVGHQRKGHGERILSALLDWAAGVSSIQKVELNVRETNFGAIALYQKLGFAVEGRYRAHIRLSDGRTIDDVVMGKFLRR